MLRRETHRDPICFSRRVVVHISESHTFEPRRGSWAEVSLVIPAIHDHWPIFVQTGHTRLLPLEKRNIDRIGYVLVSVFFAAHDFYALRSLAIQLRNHIS